MANFAKLKSGNIVERVEAISNTIATTEQAGIDFLKDLHKEPHGIWVQTSFNATIRKNFAGIGYSYDFEREAFLPPKPYDSWTLNETTCKWDPPVAYPSNAIEEKKVYAWNEITKVWDEIQ
tara:strand:+ start:375 stop:737 length:363 start_codon:yes stop_codon:yes gene_type:complete